MRTTPRALALSLSFSLSLAGGAAVSLPARAHAQELAPVEVPPTAASLPEARWPAEAPRPRPRAHRFELRAVVGAMVIGTDGTFGRAASRWGYRGLGYALGLGGASSVVGGGGVAGSYALNDYVRVGGRVVVVYADAGRAWYDGARLELTWGQVAPQIEARLPVFTNDGGLSRRFEFLARGAVGLAVGRTDLRGETHVGAGLHGSLAGGMAGSVGPITVTLELGYSWNLWDSGSVTAVQLHGFETQLGAGVRW